MKFTGSVDENRQILIPTEIVDSMHLVPGAPVQIEIQKVVPNTPMRFDAMLFKQGLAKYMGSKRQQMLDEGYASVDEMMEDIRPR